MTPSDLKRTFSGTVPDQFFQTLFFGLSQGASYALIALGYTMVYGVLGMINFAHGEIFMLGAYAGILALAGAATFGVVVASPFLAIGGAILAAVVVCAAYGATLERVAYRPLRRAHPLASLISAIGVSIFFQNYVQIAQGTDNKVFLHAVRSAFDGIAWPISFLSPIEGIILLAACLVMAALHFFVTRTRWGTALRAVSQDPVMASLAGIPVDRAIAGTFVLGSSLAAVAGVLVALGHDAHPYMGYLAGLKAFTAAVLGGIGSIPGAMLGGMLLGVVEVLGSTYLPIPEYKDALAFVILVGILLVRPAGLMGQKAVVKV